MKSASSKYIGISLHAPVKGATWMTFTIFFLCSLFQSTHPWRVRQRIFLLCIYVISNFNPHAHGIHQRDGYIIAWTSPAYRSGRFLRRLLFKFPPEIRIALFSKGCPKAPYTVPRNRSSAYFYEVYWRRRWCRHWRCICTFPGAWYTLVSTSRGWHSIASSTSRSHLLCYLPLYRRRSEKAKMEKT